MKIILGSTSEDKKNILVEALASLGEKDLDIIGVEVDSGITDQPVDEKTTVQGSINRAVNASKMIGKGELSVGMEGGLVEIAGVYNLICVVTIYHRGKIYTGTSSTMELPKEVSDWVKQGGQFGELIREFANRHKDNEEVSLLSQELISRRKLFTEAVNKAYAQWAN